MKTVYAILVVLTIMICYSLTNPSGAVGKIQQKNTASTSRNEIKKQHHQPNYQPNVADIPAQMIDSCRRFLGTPHQFGGDSKQGIDCSGLLYVNFKSIGILIPRNSSKQSAFFKKVPNDKPQVGDLLFFGTNENVISHAGIVTGVDSEATISFIHTSSSHGVVEEELTGTYWTSKLQSICRPNYEVREASS